MKNEKDVICFLAEKHKKKLVEKLSAKDFLRINFIELNRTARRLAKVELRTIQKEQMITI